MKLLARNLTSFENLLTERIRSVQKELSDIERSKVQYFIKDATFNDSYFQKVILQNIRLISVASPEVASQKIILGSCKQSKMRSLVVNSERLINTLKAIEALNRLLEDKTKLNFCSEDKRDERESLNLNSIPNSPINILDLPTEILEKVIFLLPKVDAYNLMEADDILNCKLRPAYYRLYPILINFPAYESSKHNTSGILCLKNYFENKLISSLYSNEPRVLIVVEEYSLVRRSANKCNIFTKEYDCNVLKNGPQWIESQPENKLTPWSKGALLISRLKNLRILKIRVSNLKLLILCVKFLPDSLVSLIIEINSGHLKCDFETQKLVRDMTLGSYQLSNKHCKLQYLSLRKIKGPPLIECKVKFLCFQCLNHMRSIQELRSSHAMHKTTSPYSSQYQTVAECFGRVMSELIFQNRETLAVVDISRVDAHMIFRHLKASTEAKFPHLVTLNICYISIPLINDWMVSLVNQNNYRKHSDNNNKTFPKRFYTSTYIRGEPLLSDKNGEEIWKEWGGGNVNWVREKSGSCKEWYIKHNVDKYLPLY